MTHDTAKKVLGDDERFLGRFSQEYSQRHALFRWLHVCIKYGQALHTGIEMSIYPQGLEEKLALFMLGEKPTKEEVTEAIQKYKPRIKHDWVTNPVQVDPIYQLSIIQQWNQSTG